MVMCGEILNFKGRVLLETDMIIFLDILIFIIDATFVMKGLIFMLGEFLALRIANI